MQQNIDHLRNNSEQKENMNNLNQSGNKTLKLFAIVILTCLIELFLGWVFKNVGNAQMNAGLVLVLMVILFLCMAAVGIFAIIRFIHVLSHETVTPTIEPTRPTQTTETKTEGQK